MQFFQISLMNLDQQHGNQFLGITIIFRLCFVYPWTKRWSYVFPVDKIKKNESILQIIFTNVN